MIKELAVTTNNSITLEQLTFITTLILMIITGYYAIITHRILNYQKKIAELEYRPFIKMDEIIINTSYSPDGKSIAGIQWGIKLVNVSRVLIKYEVDKMDGSIGHFINASPDFVDSKGYLYPGQYNNFYYPTIFINEELGEYFEGELAYELIYYSNNKKKYKSKRTYLVSFNKIENNKIMFDYRSKDEEEIEL